MLNWGALEHNPKKSTENLWYWDFWFICDGTKYFKFAILGHEVPFCAQSIPIVPCQWLLKNNPIIESNGRGSLFFMISLKRGEATGPIEHIKEGEPQAEPRFFDVIIFKNKH